MADNRDAEIRRDQTEIENLLVAANYPHVRQQTTITYLKELQVLRQWLQELEGDNSDH